MGAASDHQSNRHREDEHADRQHRQEIEAAKQPGNGPGEENAAAISGSATPRTETFEMRMTSMSA